MDSNNGLHNAQLLFFPLFNLIRNLTIHIISVKPLQLGHAWNFHVGTKCTITLYESLFANEDPLMEDLQRVSQTFLRKKRSLMSRQRFFCPLVLSFHLATIRGLQHFWRTQKIFKNVLFFFFSLQKSQWKKLSCFETKR